MNLDLRLCFLAAGLAATAAAAGGWFLLELERRSARARLRRVLAERADTLSIAVQARADELAGKGLVDVTDALNAFRAETGGVASVFLWRKGHGLVWRAGGGGEFEASLHPDEKWVTDGRRTRAGRRGWFVRSLARGPRTVGWARCGAKDVCGFVLEPEGDGAAAGPRAFFAAGLCAVAALWGVLTAGPCYLWLCAERARRDVWPRLRPARVELRGVVERVCGGRRAELPEGALRVAGEPALEVSADARALVEALGGVLDAAARGADGARPVEVHVGAEDGRRAFVRVAGPGACDGGGDGAALWRLELGRQLLRRMGGGLDRQVRADGGCVFVCRLERRA